MEKVDYLSRLESYRTEAKIKLLREKMEEPERDSFCIVTEDYGFVYRILGNGYYGKIREDFQGCQKLYDAEGNEKIGGEDWYMEWIDTVMDVEKKEFVLLTDDTTGEYVEEISDTEEEKLKYVERSLEDLSFLHRYLD